MRVMATIMMMMMMISKNVVVLAENIVPFDLLDSLLKLTKS